MTKAPKLSLGNEAACLGSSFGSTAHSTSALDLKKCSRFVSQQLEQSGALILSEKLLSLSALDSGDLEILSRLSLPLLGKLVELTEMDLVQKKIKIQPAIFFPLAKLLETQSRNEIIEIFRTRILELKKDNTLPDSCLLVVDNWIGDFELSSFLDLLSSILGEVRSFLYLHLLGPSTADLKKITGKNLANGEISTTKVLAELKFAGVSSIYGGQDIDIFLEAAKQDFELSFEQDISSIPAWKEISSLPKPSGDGFFSEKGKRGTSFLSQLLFLRKHLLLSGKFQRWFPASAIPSSQSLVRSEQPLAVDLLRTIAIARLTLPEVSFVSAPLNYFGSKLAHVALAFGANDLGFAALDNETEIALGVPRIENIVRVINEHGRLGSVRMVTTQ